MVVVKIELGLQQVRIVIYHTLIIFVSLNVTFNFQTTFCDHVNNLLNFGWLVGLTMYEIYVLIVVFSTGHDPSF